MSGSVGVMNQAIVAVTEVKDDQGCLVDTRAGVLGLGLSPVTSTGDASWLTNFFRQNHKQISRKMFSLWFAYAKESIHGYLSLGHREAGRC